MNKERLLLVAEAIEKGSVRGLGFNMKVYFSNGSLYADLSDRDCGTTACVAGWALAVKDGRRRVTDTGIIALHAKHVDPMGEAEEFLELTRSEARRLFTESTGAWITPAVAARCLRVAAETGEIDYLAAAGTVRHVQRGRITP